MQHHSYHRVTFGDSRICYTKCIGLLLVLQAYLMQSSLIALIASDKFLCCEMFQTIAVPKFLLKQCTPTVCERVILLFWLTVLLFISLSSIPCTANYLLVIVLRACANTGQLLWLLGQFVCTIIVPASGARCCSVCLYNLVS